jgi:cell division protein FtsZ
VGSGRGANRATDAALSAITSPLLDYPITRARGVVFNVVGGADMTLQEVNAAASVIYESVDASANIIFGATIDDSITNGEVLMSISCVY